MNTFYSYDVIQSSFDYHSLIRYVIVGIGLIFIAGYLIFVVRHRDVSRYRDTLIIVVLVVLLTLGLQANDFIKNRNAEMGQSRIVTIMDTLAQQKNVSPKQLYANSKDSLDGLIIEIQRNPNELYAVTVSDKGNSYTFTRTNLMSSNITYVEK